MNKDNNSGRWCETWKSLWLNYFLGSFFFFVLHTIGVLTCDSITEGGGKSFSAILICHTFYLPFTIAYVQNYNYLVKKKVIIKKATRFLSGLSPIVLFEAINLVLLWHVFF